MAVINFLSISECWALSKWAIAYAQRPESRRTQHHRGWLLSLLKAMKARQSGLLHSTNWMIPDRTFRNRVTIGSSFKSSFLRAAWSTPVKYSWRRQCARKSIEKDQCQFNVDLYGNRTKTRRKSCILKILTLALFMSCMQYPNLPIWT